MLPGDFKSQRQMPPPSSHFLRQFSDFAVKSAQKREFDRKQKVTFPGFLSNRGGNRGFDRHFTCLDGFGRITDELGSVPSAHRPDLMHQISVKNAYNGGFDRTSRKPTFSFLSNSAKSADLTDIFQKERKKRNETGRNAPEPGRQRKKAPQQSRQH